MYNIKSSTFSVRVYGLKCRCAVQNSVMVSQIANAICLSFEQAFAWWASADAAAEPFS